MCALNCVLTLSIWPPPRCMSHLRASTHFLNYFLNSAVLKAVIVVILINPLRGGAWPKVRWEPFYYWNEPRHNSSKSILHKIMESGNQHK